MSQEKCDVPVSERAVLSPREFAALFGRQYVWAYRQIYAGKINVVTNLGRIMIPRSEIGRLLEAKHVYNGPDKDAFKDAVRPARSISNLTPVEHKQQREL